MIGVPMRCRGSYHLMTWVACLLTIAASGDDFNLVRLLLPPPFSLISSTLPLDDPNTDFTLPLKVTIAKVRQCDSWSPAFSLGDHLALSSPQSVLWTEAACFLSSTGTSLLINPNPPLRC
jgi:hypothetical protein